MHDATTSGGCRKRSRNSSDHARILREFTAALTRLGSQDELAAATVGASGHFGLHTVMAGAVFVRGDAIDARFYFGNWPGPWRELYPRDILGADPLVAEARRRMAPFTWTELEAERDLSPEMCAALATTREHGWRDGFAVPIHGPGGYTALVSFAGGELALALADRALLLAIAHVAHHHSRQIGSGQQSTPKLSAREVQVMRWVASGKTDWEIGRILNISESTAHFHVEQVKRKLGARSRGQAASLMILDGKL